MVIKEVPYEDLYNQYRDMIHDIAFKFVGYCRILGADMDDLIQEGNIALMKAQMNYNEASGNEFSTLAYNYIEGYIKVFIAEKVKPIHIPRSAQSTMNELKAYEEKHGRIDIQDFCKIYRRDPDCVKGLLFWNDSKNLIPIHKKVTNNDRYGGNQVNAEELVFAEDDLTEIIYKDFTDLLSPEQKKILDMRISGDSYNQIGKSLGFSGQSARMKMKPIKKKAQKYFRRLN